MLTNKNLWSEKINAWICVCNLIVRIIKSQKCHKSSIQLAIWLAQLLESVLLTFVLNCYIRLNLFNELHQCLPIFITQQRSTITSFDQNIYRIQRTTLKSLTAIFANFMYFQKFWHPITTICFVHWKFQKIIKTKRSLKNYYAFSSILNCYNHSNSPVQRNSTFWIF